MSVRDEPMNVLVDNDAIRVVSVGTPGPAGPPSLDAGAIVTSEGILAIGGPDGTAVGVPSVLNAAAYDTLQEAVTAAAGQGLFIPDGTYHIDDAITVPSNSTITIAPGAIIIQDTINRPVFDCYGVTDVSISGTGQLRYEGDRTFNTVGSFRAGGYHEYLCGVYIADCERIHVDGINGYGWEAVVTMRGWDGAALASYQNKDCTIENIGVDTCEFGVLFGGYDGLTIRNIAGTYIQRATGTSTPPPAHMLYATGSTNERGRGLSIDGIWSYDSTGSISVQLKYVAGGIVRNIQARNCPGVFKVTDSQDMVIDGVIGLDDKPVASSFSILIDDDNGETERITLNGARVVHGVAERGGISIKGDDITVNDPDITGLFTADSGNGLIESVSGVRNQVNRPKLRNASTFCYRGIQVAGTAELNIVDPDIRTVGIAVYYTSAGSSGKLQIDPGRITFSASGGYTSYLERDAASTVFVERTPRLVTASTTGGGQEKIPNAMQGQTYTLTLNAGHSPVYVKTPTAPFVGALLTVEIINASGGGFTVNFDAIYKFKTAYANPTTGERQAFTFRYDDTNWQEVSRAG